MQITEKITFAMSQLFHQSTSVLFPTIVLHNEIQEQSLTIFRSSVFGSSWSTDPALAKAAKGEENRGKKRDTLLSRPLAYAHSYFSCERDAEKRVITIAIRSRERIPVKGCKRNSSLRCVFGVFRTVLKNPSSYNYRL